MSIVITRLPPDARGRVLSVRVASTEAELRAVQRLRYRIYVEDMGILSPDHPYAVGDRLVDPYDAWSTNLALMLDEVLIGTVRVTEALDGPLELSESMQVAPYLPPGAQPAELTRYMVERGHRRGVAGPLLLFAAFKVIATGRSSHMVAASKLGSLGRYYAAAGLAVADAPPFTYGLTGDRYQLGVMHIGAPRSLRRLRKWLLVGAFRVASHYMQAFAHWGFRRRLRPEARPPALEVRGPALSSPRSRAPEYSA